MHAKPQADPPAVSESADALLTGTPDPAALTRTIASLDWTDLGRQLHTQGYARIPGLLNRASCREIASWYPDDYRFRSRVIMARHGFGQGQYKYFAYPLPVRLQQLRSAFYPPLARIANEWNRQLGMQTSYPDTLQAMLRRCHDAGQTRPTPLILQYARGDYNCLHQDLYGTHVFPLQLAVLLSAPEVDFSGGEFVITETVGSQQRAHVVQLQQGDALIFAVSHRPATGKRGMRKANLRHGVSQIRDGKRHTLGIIFHDAG